MSAEFDQFSQNYDELVNQALKPTYLEASYLSAYKLRKISQVLPDFQKKEINFLDFGCGQGNFCKNYYQFFPKGNYFGVDISEKMIGQANEKLGNLGTFYEFNSLKWKQNNYDIIFSSCVFHHISPLDHLNTLSELQKLLAKNGKIVLWEHNPFNPITRKLVKDCALDENAILIKPNQMKKTFANAGLKTLVVQYATYFPKYLHFLNPLETFLCFLPFGAQYFIIGEKQCP